MTNTGLRLMEILNADSTVIGFYVDFTQIKVLKVVKKYRSKLVLTR